jgi:hypothetical protein
LVHRGDLYVEVVVGQIEVGGEPLDRFAFGVVLDGEAPRLVVPGDSVEVEE